MSYVIENFWSTLESVEYVDTFKALRLKHEQEVDRSESSNDTKTASYVVCTCTHTLPITYHPQYFIPCTSILISHILVHTFSLYS